MSDAYRNAICNVSKFFLGVIVGFFTIIGLKTLIEFNWIIAVSIIGVSLILGLLAILFKDRYVNHLI